MKRIALFFFVAALFCGSGSVSAQVKRQKAEEKISFNQTEAVNLGASHEMLIAPVTAQVAVTAERAFFEKDYPLIVDPTGRNKGFASVEAIQAQALFDFTQQEQADMIVCSLCSLKTTGEPEVSGEVYTYTIHVQMQGYPGRYTDFQPTKKEDIWIKHMYSLGQMRDGDQHIYVNIEKVQEILKNTSASNTKQ